MGGGPAAETLKKMAALHRRLEEKTGSGSEDHPLFTSGYGASRHAPYAAPYQLPVSRCTGNSRCGMMYGAGASKPLSHYPATAAPSVEVAFPHYGHRAAEPELGGVGTASSLYMSQSQCVDFRLSHPGVQVRASMAQSADVRSTSPSSAVSGWTGGGRYVHAQPAYQSSDHRRDWISSPYSRPPARHPPQRTTANVGCDDSRVLHGFSVNQEQSLDVISGSDAAYCDYVRLKQRQNVDRHCTHPTSESRWTRRHHHPATSAAGHVTSNDVQLPVADDLLFDTYTGSNVDTTFTDDIDVFDLH